LKIESAIFVGKTVIYIKSTSKLNYNLKI